MAATPINTPFLFLGTWKWKKNAASSVERSFPLPQQGTTVISQEADGIHFIAVGIYSDGQTRHTESTFLLDGGSYPVIGGTLGDALGARQRDAHSLDITVTRAGALSARIGVTVSADGDVMTTRCGVIVPQGANIVWTTVSERQRDD